MMDRVCLCVNFRFGHAIIATVFSTWIAYKNGPKIAYRSRKSIKMMKISATTTIKANTFRSKWKQSNGAARSVAPIIPRQKYVCLHGFDVGAKFQLLISIQFSVKIPQHYACFCKKEFNPANHLWLVPHSCGELCGKPLKSQYGLCSHRCMILCHPGPCPPCSQTIPTSCECNKSNLRTIRCVQQSWKCGNKVKYGRCVPNYRSPPAMLNALFLSFWFYSVRNCSHAVYIHATKSVIRCAHRVPRRANRNAFVAIRHRNAIAVTWCGHAKRYAIIYMNVDGIDAKSNAIAATVAHAQPDYCDHAHAAKR